MSSRTPRIDRQDTAPAPRPRSRVWLARGTKLALATLLFGLFVEGGLRVLLFTDHAGVKKATRRLRSADNFAHRHSPEYWKLQRMFALGPRKEANYEPRLGWMPLVIDRETYDHAEHDPGSGKRPVLLYGDSFAQCVIEREDCWQGLLARSELGSTHQLINYGSGGYGFDQAFLLLRASLPNYAGEDPLVILSLLVDDDLDRSILPFRSWPKPRLEIGPDGKLLFEGPVERDPLAYLADHPPRIASYLWRYLLHGTNWIPPQPRLRWIDKPATFREIRRLNRRILAEARQVLENAGVEYFVLLFHGRGYFNDPPADRWREGFVIQELDRLGMPWVSSLEVLKAERDASGRSHREYFIEKGSGKGHYGAFGNEVVFEAIRRGIGRRYDGSTEPDPVGEPFTRELPGEGSFARFGTRPLPPFDREGDTPRWVLGAGDAGPTRLAWRLFGAVESFSATLGPVPGHPIEGAIELSIECDGERRFAHTLEPGGSAVPVRVDLTGTHELELRLNPIEGAGGAILLGSPDFVRP